MATVKVLLVDDDALVRAGLRLILSSADDIEVVGETDDGAGAAAAVRQHRPDVVLMDIRMPQTDGITATAALRRLDPPPQVIVLTTFQADEHVVAALRAGASGFLVKDTPPDRHHPRGPARGRRRRYRLTVGHPHAAVPLREHCGIRAAPTRPPNNSPY